MEKMRGAHSFRPRVRQGPTPPAVGPSAAGPSTAVAGASPSVPAVHLLTAGDAEGSFSVAPAQRRYHTRVGPTPPSPSHPRPACRAPPAKRAQTSGLGESCTSRFRAPPSPPYQGIPELQIYLRYPSSGGLTSPATLSRGMLAAGIEISMRRCTTISRHFSRTQGSETPCSSCSDTIWSHSWCRVSSVILG